MRNLLIFVLLFFTTIANASTYDVTIVRVIDGDTVRVAVQVWHDQTLTTSVRLAGINAPESKAKAKCEREAAAEAKAKLANLIQGVCIIDNPKPDKFGGRYRAVLWCDGKNVSVGMLDSGLAHPYHGEKRGAWCND